MSIVGYLPDNSSSCSYRDQTDNAVGRCEIPDIPSRRHVLDLWCRTRGLPTPDVDHVPVREPGDQIPLPSLLAADSPRCLERSFPVVSLRPGRRSLCVCYMRLNPGPLHPIPRYAIFSCRVAIFPDRQELYGRLGG